MEKNSKLFEYATLTMEEDKIRMEYVNSTNNSSKKSKGIKDDELLMMLNDLRDIFNNKNFSNKDLPQELLIKWGLSNKQTPSRLKKLAVAGKLKIISETPYVYELIA
ncbi:MAG: hypothetical protein HUJ68_14305 [Clostridia bacterium]|nr:hypothetical protein [Clostridia bacterium]